MKSKTSFQLWLNQKSILLLVVLIVFGGIASNRAIAAPTQTPVLQRTGGQSSFIQTPTTRTLNVNNVLSGGGVTGLFDQITQQLQALIQGVQTYMNQVIAQQIEPLGEDLQSAVSSVMGDLGIPDPIAARENIKVATTGTFAGDSATESRVLANEVDRQVTRATAASVLSAQGQQRTLQDLQRTQQTVEDIQQKAQQAQAAVSTQDVLKASTQQTAKMAEIMGSLHADNVQARQDAQNTNMNLTNISSSLDEANRTKQRESMGDAYSTLRVSSQAGLF